VEHVGYDARFGNTRRASPSVANVIHQTRPATHATICDHYGEPHSLRVHDRWTRSWTSSLHVNCSHHLFAKDAFTSRTHLLLLTVSKGVNMSPSILEAATSQSFCAPSSTKMNGSGENAVVGALKPASLQHTTLTSSSNPSLQVTADHTIKLVPAPVYKPGYGEALVHVRATGVCGSDIHFWKTGAIGSLKVEGDCILGHEGAGVVLECGEGVSDLQPGDRVAIEPGVPCGSCFLCVAGRYNLCEDVNFAGVYPYHGTLQRYKVHPARWLHK
jgi:hypothetical protein